MTSTEIYKKRLAVTGGAGFIGTNLLLYLVPKHIDYLFVNIDCLTYAGNLMNLESIEDRPNYVFKKIDLREFDRLKAVFDEYDLNGVIHLAAESHVDRSIYGPADFVNTNIIGTFHLLELARRGSRDFRFLHVSTDEVYGSLGPKGYFTEDTPYRPSSPYSASKAAADHLVRSYFKTYDLNVVTTNCSNNFGPFQFPEKLIPLTINNVLESKAVPVYGDGRQVRDWLYVGDHCRALELVFDRGQAGATYNIGCNNELPNIELVRMVCRLMDKRLGGGPRENLIEFVGDRPGHDRRYAIDAAFLRKTLGWRPQSTFEESLAATVGWYLENTGWLKSCLTGEYRDYYERNYLRR